MRRVVTILVVLFSLVVRAQMTTETKEELMKAYRSKMSTYLDRTGDLSKYYSIDLNGISIYADTIHEQNAVPEFFVRWEEVHAYRKVMLTCTKDSALQILLKKSIGAFPAEFSTSEEPRLVYNPPVPKDIFKPLKGMKIALDPGHMAGDTAMGRIEEKFLKFKVKRVPPGLDTNMYRIHQVGDSIEIHLVEGMLTWKVASDLASDLRGKGAIVLLTRKGPGVSAFGKTFEEWKHDDYARTLDSLLRIDPTNKNLIKLKNGTRKDDRFIFRYVFRDVELRKRAEIINAFHPDLTVIIHFNVDEKNKDWLHPTDKNFCMAFVGGSFLKGELDETESRFDFLRLLLTDDMEQSVRASGQATTAFASYLKVPLAQTDDATYLQKYCAPTTQAGVFCRNLSMTRMVEGTLIYGETLYQDNVLECLELSSYFEVNVEGKTEHEFIYPRLNNVTSAYESAILKWAAGR